MSTTATAKPAPARRLPSVATMRARLAAASVAHDDTPKGIKAAFLALPTTPTPAPASKPKARKTAAPKPSPAKATTPKRTPSDALCACGCGRPTITAKALFVSGHDARLAGVLGRAAATGDATAVTRIEALSPGLKAKALRIADTARKQAAVKAARAVAKEQAKAAYAAALKAAMATA